MIDSIFGSKCSGSNIIDDFVTSYSKLTERYNNDLHTYIESALKSFEKIIADFIEKSDCMKADESFPFALADTLQLETRFLLAARLASQFDFKQFGDENMISTTKMALFRKIKEILEKLWLIKPPVGEDCEERKRIINNPTFTEMSLLVQNEAIGYIEKDCVRELLKNYAEWHQEFPSSPNKPHECIVFLYGIEDGVLPPYCKGK